MDQVAPLGNGAHSGGASGAFRGRGGDELCRDCGGACCEKGKNHMTLVNFFACHYAGSVPEPDFTLTCPFLSEKGCRISPPHRPFNCVTFICDRIEENLPTEKREEFYSHEKKLRTIYEEFDLRYAASSLRGILIRAARLGERPLLAPPAHS